MLPPLLRRGRVPRLRTSCFAFRAAPCLLPSASPGFSAPEHADLVDLPCCLAVPQRLPAGGAGHVQQPAGRRNHAGTRAVHVFSHAALLPSFCGCELPLVHPCSVLFPSCCGLVSLLPACLRTLIRSLTSAPLGSSCMSWRPIPLECRHLILIRLCLCPSSASQFTRRGDLGVDVFFVLSGFLIAYAPPSARARVRLFRANL